MNCLEHNWAFKLDHVGNVNWLKGGP